MSLNLIDQAAQRKRIDDLLANPVESAKELESLRQQLASRDAEIAKLRQAALDYDKRWHEEQVKCDQLRNHVKLLRSCVEQSTEYRTGNPAYEHALAATEPK